MPPKKRDIAKVFSDKLNGPLDPLEVYPMLDLNDDKIGNSPIYYSGLSAHPGKLLVASLDQGLIDLAVCNREDLSNLIVRARRGLFYMDPPFIFKYMASMVDNVDFDEVLRKVRRFMDYDDFMVKGDAIHFDSRWRRQKGMLVDVFSDTSFKLMESSQEYSFRLLRDRGAKLHMGTIGKYVIYYAEVDRERALAIKKKTRRNFDGSTPIPLFGFQ